MALAISLFGALAIMQVYVGSEGSKRAAGSLAEAQSGGVAAVFSIEREVQKAGMGFAHGSALGCIVRSNLPSNFNDHPLQPVSIIPSGAGQTHASNLWGIPPGDADSDMLAVAAGSASVMAEGAVLKKTEAPAATTFTLSNTTGVTVGDYLLIAERDKQCTLTTVAQAPSANGQVLVSNAGAASYSLSAAVLHLGRSPEFVVFAVRNGNLTRCDFLISDCSDSSKTTDTRVWVPIANDVVALRAQYGIDTATTFSADSKVIDLYCRSRVASGATCAAADTGLTAPGANLASHVERACDWARIPIVQVALVTRSGGIEKENVSPATLKLWPDSAVAPTTTGPEWTVPDRKYRYRVTYSASALRNMVWMKAGVAPSC